MPQIFDRWQRRQQQVRAVKRIAAVKQHYKGSVQGGWAPAPWVHQLQPLSASAEPQSDLHPSRTQLHLPCPGMLLRVTLPPGLSLAATRTGQLDVRLQLLDVAASWPAGPGDGGPRVLPARSGLLSSCSCAAAALLLHGLYPQHASRLLGLLAIPLAVADAAGTAVRLLPPRVRALAAPHLGLDGAAEEYAHQQQRVPRGGRAVLAAVHVTVLGVLQVLRDVSGPAAVLASGAWLWQLLHPSSHQLLQCLVAVAAVAADYNALGRQAAQGRIQSGPPLEAAWRARHKAAAQRLAPFLGDLPTQPLLAPVMNGLGQLTIAAGAAVEGCGLLGAVDTTSIAPASAAGQRLLLAASYSTNPGPAVPPETSTQLQRQQLLELFATPAIPGAGQTLQSSKGSKAATSRSASLKASDDCAIVDASCQHQQQQQQIGPTSAAKPASFQPPSQQGPSKWADTCSLAGCKPVRAPPTDSSWPTAGSTAGTLTGRLRSRARGGSTAAAAAASDPLAFLSQLPLYGQADHAVGPGVQLTWSEWSGLGWRAIYLMLVFTPFFVAGLPMLLLAAGLMRRAAGMQQLQQRKLHLRPLGSPAVAAAARLDNLEQAQQQAEQALACSDLAGDGSAWDLEDLGSIDSVPPFWSRAAAFGMQVLVVLGALADLVLLLLVGGHWQRGVSAWEAGALFLRRRAWQLLHWGCCRSGAAFIKWGQWAAARRDLFPADFSDTMASLHDRAPMHSYRHSKAIIERSFGRPLSAVFDTFERKPIASGSIAQIHRATVRLPGQSTPRLVAVKVRHPNVQHHIQQDFKLLRMLSQVASDVPALRGLSLRQTVSQFSHTMTAQADLRVEAIHALRFGNNFSGVSSNVHVPRPVPGLVTKEVLVETFEPGASIAYHIACPSPLNTQVVALGVDTFLKMLLVDNFVHTDLHPGNILVRERPQQQQQQQQQQPDQGTAQQGGSKRAGKHSRGWLGWLRPAVGSSSSSSSSNGGSDREPGPQQQQPTQQQQQQQQQARAWPWSRWWPQSSRAGASVSSSCSSGGASAAVDINSHGTQVSHQPSKVSVASRSSSNTALLGAPTAVPEGYSTDSPKPASSLQQQPSSELEPQQSGPSARVLAQLLAHQAEHFMQANSHEAQLVLLDFGLAEQLTPQVRLHFISFLNHICSGNGARAARHLLQWSADQQCPDRMAFVAAMRELFDIHCDIQSEQGINLDVVLKEVLTLARHYSVSIDSSYASLVVATAVIVGFATSLDPQVNLMDAATPTLLAYALTGRVFGRLYQ